MARPAITYRAARRNLVIRDAKGMWNRHYTFSHDRKRVRGAAPKMGEHFLQNLLFAVNVAERIERAGA